MSRRPAIAALLALSSIAAFGGEVTLEEAPGRRRRSHEPEPRFRRQHYFLDIPLRSEGRGRRELPPPAATPQPGAVKGKRKPPRAERKRAKARRS